MFGILSGKKTIIGSLLLSLLGAVWCLDILINGTAHWLTNEQYIAIVSTIGGLTGAAMRLAIGKVEENTK